MKEIFDYNPKAKSMYEKCDFKQYGIKREALYTNNNFYNIHIMLI